MSLKHSSFKVGDSMIEVIFAITIFSVVATTSIALMNSGLANAQAILEITMARNEIKAQSEAISFIHNSFSAEREYKTGDTTTGISKAEAAKQQLFSGLWQKISRAPIVNEPQNVAYFNSESCEIAYQGDAATGEPSIFDNHAFIVNTRLIDPTQNIGNIIITSHENRDIFTETPLYPRLIYTKNAPALDETKNSDEMLESDQYIYLKRAEGIWVIAIRDMAKDTPEFFDFHIRTCWYAPGRTHPTTIGTIIRLYNPELYKESR